MLAEIANSLTFKLAREQTKIDTMFDGVCFLSSFRFTLSPPRLRPEKNYYVFLITRSFNYKGQIHNHTQFKKWKAVVNAVDIAGDWTNGIR